MNMHPNDTTLNDYADGTLGAAERPGVEQHLAGCAACRQLVDDLREILARRRRAGAARAAGARVVAPRARDQDGAEHAAPIDAAPGRATPTPAPPPKAGRYRATRRGSRRRRRSCSRRWSACATRRRGTPSAAGAPRRAPSAAITASDAAQSIETELRQAEAHYEKAIKGLEAIANSEQSELDPRTAATLQKNLAVIDQAISESRAAVRAQPASEPAQQSLIEGFKTKIGLLQDTVALINEMRKGNEAGAARIASGLKQKGT